ncbi:CHAT domain-containing protein [Agromyces intestinalis]|uniref:CHAT domain-containing protein n=1 Tax=Agromyces intestinalis TaxID=2592652 RepID=A0A5C1YHQ9_9MICO|nr:CHAT domain-containing protein [Agromyces intestinalis]QEO15493.1 CHAT domain-containing protein [Agromyces intestinalis]
MSRSGEGAHRIEVRFADEARVVPGGRPGLPPEWAAFDRPLRLLGALEVLLPAEPASVVAVVDGLDDADRTVLGVARSDGVCFAVPLRGIGGGAATADLPTSDGRTTIFVLGFARTADAERFLDRWGAAPRPPLPRPGGYIDGMTRSMPGFDLDDDGRGGGFEAALDAEPVAADEPIEFPEAAEPAAAEPAEPEPAEPVEPATRGRRVTAAHVDAEMPPELVAGESFELIFRLSREALTATPGLVRDEEVIRVDEDRDVTVSITLRGIHHAPGDRAERTVPLPAPGADPARVPFRLVADEPGRGVVWIAVRQEPIEQPLATLRVSAAIVESASAVPGPAPNPRTRVSGRSSELAALPTIRIDESISRGRSTLRIAVSVGDERAVCTKELPDKAAYIRRLYSRVGGIRAQVDTVRDAKARRRRAAELLSGIGSDIARYLFDDHVNDLLWRSRTSRLSHLVVQTEGEFDLPWEIVHLVPPSGAAGDGKRWFLADLGMTRLVYGSASPEPIRVRPDRALAVSPRYHDPILALPRTAAEIAALADHLAARVVLDVETPAAISSELRDGVDLLHFAGHGRWRADEPTAQQLLLAAFPSSADDEASTYSDADARADFPEERALEGVTPASFVFLSACDVGRLQSGPTGLGGFAEAFLRGGVAAFIGCGWAVRDDVAARFVTTFYDAALARELTIGEATLEARQAARRVGDVSALAFAVFADPRARLVPARE